MHPVKAFRKSRNWSQQDLATALGGSSRGYICDLETGRQPWPLRLALKLEQLSEGKIRAADLSAEAAALGAQAQP